MTKRRSCLAVLGCMAAASLSIVSDGRAADIRLLSSWDKTNPAVGTLAEAFAKDVETATKGDLKFIINGPETVPPFEQLQPVAAGAFQMLFTHAIYHYGTTGSGVGMDSVRGDPESRRKSGMIELLDQHYRKLGVKVVAVAISATRGYHIVLRAPVNPAGDLQGRKLRGRRATIRCFRCSVRPPWFCPAAKSTPRWRRAWSTGRRGRPRA